MQKLSLQTGVIVLLSLFSLSVSAAEKSVFRPYGTAIPSVIFANQGVESFGYGNMSAYTAAGNPRLGNQIDASRMTFQVAQSRIGACVGKEALQGRFEFDFMNSALATPTTGSNPRLRRATIEYSLNPEDVLTLGQDWDLFSPLNPHTYNIVGLFYQAGNVGFMRQQAAWVRTAENYEWGAAVGLAGSNGTSTDSGLELSNTPTVSLRGAYILNDQNRVGVSVIATQILTNPTQSLRRSVYGLNFYSDLKFFGGDLSWRTQGYYGRNLNNIGTLSLAFGSDQSDTFEAGGWTTAHYQLDPRWGIFGGIGLAAVLNAEGMGSSYNVSGSTATLGNNGPGIERNMTAHFGVDFEPVAHLTWFAEGAYLNTLHHLKPADWVAYESLRTAVVVQSGFKLEL